MKSNWPALHAEIERYFADAPASACDRLETTDGDHGRIEVRRHAVSRDVAPRRSTDRRCCAVGSSAPRRTMARRRPPPSRRAALSRPHGGRPSGACRRRLLWRRSLRLVEAEVERAGTTTLARRYYLSSARLDAATFARAVRSHWGIENRLHWILDVVFHDDLVRLRTGHGAENMATVRHMAVNLVRDTHGKHSLKVRRKKAAWSQDYLETLLRRTA